MIPVKAFAEVSFNTLNGLVVSCFVSTVLTENVFGSETKVFAYFFTFKLNGLKSLVASAPAFSTCQVGIFSSVIVPAASVKVLSLISPYLSVNTKVVLTIAFEDASTIEGRYP